MKTSEMIDIVRAAWSAVPAPPKDDMKILHWEGGEDAVLAFTGVAPMDVDVESIGFDMTTPLLDLPPRAAAAYLGTFLISLLQGLDFQERVGIFDDFLSRAHTLQCLTQPKFWEEVIRKCSPPECQEAVVKVSRFLASKHDDLPLDQEQVDTLVALANRLDE